MGNSRRSPAHMQAHVRLRKTPVLSSNLHGFSGLRILAKRLDRDPWDWTRLAARAIRSRSSANRRKLTECVIIFGR